MLDAFREVWFVDFEFEAPVGELPKPICMVAEELHSGRCIRLFGDELRAQVGCPYSLSSDSLLVAYFASAELGCHLALGWKFPANVLDLFSEFRNSTNGVKLSMGSGLLGALAHFGLNPMAAAHKEAMRGLARRGGPWTETERKDLLDYCFEDCKSLFGLLTKMEVLLDLPRALQRGRYMKAIARMEAVGIPVAVDVLTDLRTRWKVIRRSFIEEIDADFGVYEGTRFSQRRFRHWLGQHNIDWPIEGQRLKLDKKTFKVMAGRFPEVEPLRQLRQIVSQLRTMKLAAGSDGYSRCLLSPFRSKTGRNQPSTTKFIFGLSKWSRNLIQPKPGTALAYVDWEQQEFGIAAALSGDEAMIEAYRTGDSYLAFAKQAGAVPPEATKDTHPITREQYKQCALAVQYCMGPASLAEKLGIYLADSGVLLERHHQTYNKFWKWSDAAVDYAHLHGEIHTTFGWSLKVNGDTSERTIRNFPMQANGAEMLRLACCMITEQGIKVCAPVHDAVLIEAPFGEIEEVKEEVKKVMAEASSVVLAGFALRSDAMVITKSKPFQKADSAMWGRLMSRLVKLDAPEVMGSVQVCTSDKFRQQIAVASMEAGV